jgi:hypothetical protein
MRKGHAHQPEQGRKSEKKATVHGCGAAGPLGKLKSGKCSNKGGKRPRFINTQ